jgi:chorismate-pyruvate lyase
MSEWCVVDGWSKWNGDLTARFRHTENEIEVEVLHQGRVVAGSLEPARALTILEWMEEWGEFEQLAQRIHGRPEEF